MATLGNLEYYRVTHQGIMVNARLTLACCIVVRNEKDKILKNLERLVPIADQVIVVDTGSTDNTPAFIRGWASHFMPNKVKIFEEAKRFHDQDDDFHFGNAKSFALSCATTDFVMWLDANDVISDPVAMRKHFDAVTQHNREVYFVMPTQLSEKFAFMRARCAPRDACNVVGRVHEYLNMWRDLERTFIPIPIVNSKTGGRDLARNLRLLKKDWLERENGRTTFYIAQTLREMGDDAESIRWFRKRIYQFEFKDEYKEEHFKSIESICEILITFMYPGWTHEDIRDLANEMIRLEPNRMEGYYYLGHYHMKQLEYESALKCFRMYPQCRIPEKYNLWLNRGIYGGKAVLTEIEFCKVAIKNKTPLVPDEIVDFGGGGSNSTYSRSSAQYTVQ